MKQMMVVAESAGAATESPGQCLPFRNLNPFFQDFARRLYPIPL